MIGFLADIHGNYPALSAVIDALDRLRVSECYSLGDVAGYYPMINECIALLKERNIPNILGNHDNYLVNQADCPRSETVNLAIRHQRSLITDENLAWLKTSSSFFDTELFYAVHGGLHDFLEEYTTAPQFPESVSRPLYLNGHTHKPLLASCLEKTYCNPGSVGQPRDGDPRASFAVLLDSGEVRLYRVPYNIDEIAKQSKEAGFEPRFYECLYFGTSIKPKKGSHE